MNRYSDGYYNDSYYEPDDEDFDDSEYEDALDDADERVDEDEWERD